LEDQLLAHFIADSKAKGRLKRPFEYLCDDEDFAVLPLLCR